MLSSTLQPQLAIDATGLASPAKAPQPTVHLACQDSTLMARSVTFAPEIATNATTLPLAKDAEKDSP